ncbi:MAG: peptidase S41 [Planctomycetaceae bacterium]|nr:peptidase S41 [Planctomycetaceae bacterium]
MFAWLLALTLVPLTSIEAQEGSEAEPAEEQKSLTPEDYELMKVFVDSFEQIRRNYVREVSGRELIDAAIRGMLGDLDRYSNYISPEDRKRFEEDVEQEFGGIGIKVTPELVVMTPLPGTPAYKAGVLTGDRIVKINGTPTSEFPKGRELENAIKMLKGKPGVKVSISVEREGAEDPIKIEIERAIIRVATVLGDKYDDNNEWDFMLDEENKIGYIRLTQFSRRSNNELVLAMERLKSQGMKGLILDLRFNPGGLLSQAIEISDMFVEEGRIVSTQGRYEQQFKKWDAHKSGTYSDFPMAILVNRFSASASEIVSACLQDHKRAIIVGERTWGKGSVQNVINLEEGGSALKLTTASYHRPSGVSIHRQEGATEKDVWGVMPDDEFKLKLNVKELRDLSEWRRKRDVIGPPESEFVDRQRDLAIKGILAKLNGEDAADEEKDEKAEDKDDSEKKAADIRKLRDLKDAAFVPKRAIPLPAQSAS